jgi:MFS family permease
VGVFNAAREAGRAMSDSVIGRSGRLSPEFKIVIVMALGFGLVGIDRFLIATTTSAFLPNYFIDYLKLPFAEMGGIMSAIGLGSTAGTLALPWLSDYIGRKPVASSQ